MNLYDLMLQRGIDPDDLLDEEAEPREVAGSRALLPSVATTPQISLPNSASPRGVAAVQGLMRMMGGGMGGGMGGDPELRRRLRKVTEAQEAGIDENAAVYDKLKSLPSQMDYSPLMKLVDTWTGSKLAEGYQKPQSPQEKLMDVAKIGDAVQKQRSAYTDDMLKQQTAGAGGLASMMKLANLQNRRDRSSEEDLYRLMKQAGRTPSLITNLVKLEEITGGFDDPESAKTIEGVGGLNE